MDVDHLFTQLQKGVCLAARRHPAGCQGPELNEDDWERCAAAAVDQPGASTIHDAPATADQDAKG
jgi:hypothetical protein